MTENKILDLKIRNFAMGWNPTPGVTTARDAARKHNGDMAIVVVFRRDGQLQLSSYGETKAKCDFAGKFLEPIEEAILSVYEDEELDAMRKKAAEHLREWGFREE